MNGWSFFWLDGPAWCQEEYWLEYCSHIDLKWVNLVNFEGHIGGSFSVRKHFILCVIVIFMHYYSDYWSIDLMVECPPCNWE